MILTFCFLNSILSVIPVSEISSKEKFNYKWIMNENHARFLLSECTSSAVALDRISGHLKVTQVMLEPSETLPGSRKRRKDSHDPLPNKRKNIEYDNLLMLEREILSHENSRRNEQILTSTYEEEMKFIAHLIEKRIETYRQSHDFKKLLPDEQLRRVSRFYGACVLDDVRDLTGKQFSPSYVEIAMTRPEVERIGHENLAGILFNELLLLGFVTQPFESVTHYGVGIERDDESFVATASINDQGFNEKRRGKRRNNIRRL